MSDRNFTKTTSVKKPIIEDKQVYHVITCAVDEVTSDNETFYRFTVPYKGKVSNASLGIIDISIPDVTFVISISSIDSDMRYSFTVKKGNNLIPEFELFPDTFITFSLRSKSPFKTKSIWFSGTLK